MTLRSIIVLMLMMHLALMAKTLAVYWMASLLVGVEFKWRYALAFYLVMLLVRSFANDKVRVTNRECRLDRW